MRRFIKTSGVWLTERFLAQDDPARVGRISAETLESRVIVPTPQRCPPLVIIAGPCRSGTTALLRVIAYSGHHSYFQPFKRLVRRLTLGTDACLEIPSGHNPIVIKETFGPFIPEEVELDPVSILLDCGYPRSKINVIAMLRSPERVYRSWKQSFERDDSPFGEVKAEIFSRSYCRAKELYEAAGKNNIAATAYVPDALCDLDAHPIIARLFERVGLRFSPEAIDWSGKPPFGSPGSNIIREREPGHFRAAGVIDSVKSSESYAHYHLTDETLDSNQQMAKLPTDRLLAIYRFLCDRTHSDLKIRTMKQELRKRAGKQSSAGS